MSADSVSPSREIWKPVVGFEGWYEVSSLGRVRRLIGGNGTRPGSIKNPTPDKDGYLKLGLYARDGRKMAMVHRLVARAFLGECPPGYEVNHRDGDRANNSTSNIEYATHRANIRHKFRVLGSGLGEDHGQSKLSEQHIREIRGLLASGITTASIGRMYGVNRKTVSKIRDRLTWSHVA